MTTNSNGTGCDASCWMTAAGIGFLTFLITLTLGGKSWIAAIFLGLLAAFLLGRLFIWLFCVGDPQANIATPGPAVASTASAAAAQAPAPGPARQPRPQPAPEAAAKAAADETATAAPVAATEPAAKPGKPAAAAESGPAEAVGSARAEPARAKAKPATAKPAAKAAPAAVDASPKGGTRPEALDGPRGGEADNLKEIKGVGPKLEQMFNEMGIYHFDQIAAWSADEVAWVNDNLKGFKGRVTRDNWVEQARILAEGGETEFSKRVEGGKVY